MDKILLFGGTGEGRALAEWMLSEHIPCTVCVATEYGETLLPDGAEAHVGRMDRDEMAALMAQDYALVVDATHPYAVEVTENIRAAAEAAGPHQHGAFPDGLQGADCQGLRVAHAHADEIDLHTPVLLAISA